jgi:hypothetical protein
VAIEGSPQLTNIVAAVEVTASAAPALRRSFLEIVMKSSAAPLDGRKIYVRGCANTSSSNRLLSAVSTFEQQLPKVRSDRLGFRQLIRSVVLLEALPVVVASGLSGSAAGSPTPSASATNASRSGSWSFLSSRRSL